MMKQTQKNSPELNHSESAILYFQMHSDQASVCMNIIRWYKRHERHHLQGIVTSRC